ncbi:large conductance mechanosensitive channel protein MscL [bacterium]|nr:large conductance mechanosensitive channel protein MscL [bacterium]MDY3862346.1 large conductance mechanosensitive channel protein MscL [Ruminococcus sp.]
MKKIFAEFKTFIMRGNVVDLAVGVIIGAAFQAIVNSLVNDVISPFLGIFGGMNFDQMSFTINGSEIYYGKFLTAVLNFLIMALVIFILVKIINKITSFGKKKEVKEVTTKKCPYCCTEIDIKAVKCPHCTSDIPAEEE